ncbi:MAG TPA: DinB family protein [Bacteroidia bacterium]|nr:DinB family protein [Bacteroidia bacterium]
MQRTKWTERKFSFDFPAGWLSNILTRLWGTSARIKEMTLSLKDEDASFKPAGKWSIKENIGHLSDLEELHEGRIDDFLARKETLRAADMSNAKTFAADHNKKSMGQLISEFSVKRKRFIARLEQLDDETQNFKSLHPRLQVLMRPADVAYFTAEHDDHHLADIHEILSLKKSDRNKEQHEPD